MTGHLLPTRPALERLRFLALAALGSLVAHDARNSDLAKVEHRWPRRLAVARLAFLVQGEAIRRCKGPTSRSATSMSQPGGRAGVLPRRPASGLALAATGIVALLLAACGGTPVSGSAGSGGPIFVAAVTQPPLGSRETAYDPPRPAPDIFLKDGDGHPFDLASLHGSPVFVYFGYTHCPDVCPTTLADLRKGIRLAGVDAKVVFVTIDPERDDAAAMKQYADYYAAGYIGLTGTPAQIAAVATAWGVTYARLPAQSGTGYAMAHSTDTYLLDATGQLRHHIFFGAGAALIAKLLTDVAGS